MINVVIVGYGFAGRDFHCYLVNLEEGLNLYGVCSSDPKKRQAAEERLHVRTFASLDEALKDEHTHLFILATPHDVHCQQAVQVMDAGRHCVTDKVMCLNAAEADIMLAAAARNGVLLSVFHNRRWDWDFLTLNKTLQEGLLGKPFYFESSVVGYGKPRGWRAVKASSGGLLYDWGAHLLDQALLLAPTKVRWVFCDIVSGFWDVDIGNHAHWLIKFDDETLFKIELSNVSRAPRPRWRVLGERGSFEKWGIDPQEAAMLQGNIDAATEPPEHHARVVTDFGGMRAEMTLPSVRGSWRSYYQNISEVLNKGAELIVKPEEVARAMRVYDAAMLSAQRGQVVHMEI